MKKNAWAILCATLVISLSEWGRNSLLLQTQWSEHYQNMGLIFPDKPINGVIWGAWSLCFASVIWVFRKKFTLLETIVLSWFVGFVLMWLVIGNLGVLPLRILTVAIPLSLLECSLASWIVFYLLPHTTNNTSSPTP
jgi:hypothetical protein